MGFPNLDLENNLPNPVAGIDEAGRGPLAGPVFAAAVILGPPPQPGNIKDSKTLSKKLRAKAFTELCKSATIAVASATAEEVDTLNILEATMVAMQRAVECLTKRPKFILVDGNRLPNLPYPAQAIVKGDTKSISIAAASIIAKESRDHYMKILAEQYPGYGWERNSGYGTQEHMAGLKRLGPTPHHRFSFKPVSKFSKGS